MSVVFAGTLAGRAMAAPARDIAQTEISPESNPVAEESSEITEVAVSSTPILSLSDESVETLSQTQPHPVSELAPALPTEEEVPTEEAITPVSTLAQAVEPDLSQELQPLEWDDSENTETDSMGQVTNVS
ncbi:MAG TPA: hypothetical protein DEA79_05100, partial [Cyanobacteria bacterium UBA11153]|nr:hypothetical protein [Cyanobacteria bacterium UBA11153]